MNTVAYVYGYSNPTEIEFCCSKSCSLQYCLLDSQQSVSLVMVCPSFESRIRRTVVPVPDAMWCHTEMWTQVCWDMWGMYARAHTHDLQGEVWKNTYLWTQVILEVWCGYI